MTETDVILQVRAAREAILARFGYDLRALGAHLQELDAAGDRPVVRFGPRPPEVPPAPAATDRSKGG